MEPKKLAVARKVWRITAQAPQGELVDLDLSGNVADGLTRASPKILDPAPVEDWRASSYDLLGGLEVRDHTDSIPGELFERLFKH